MALNQTVSVTSVFLNNSTIPTTVSRTVEAVVVNNQLVPDFRQVNPGVINSKYTEFPIAEDN